MQQLISVYETEQRSYNSTLSRVKKQLIASSLLRLFVFLITLAFAYFFFENTKLLIAIVLVGIAIFLYLVSRHTNLQFKRNKLIALVEINEAELKILNRDFFNRPEGDEFKEPLHHFSQDIDLFGKGSFYQYANRTALKKGSEALAHLFKENSIAAIEVKQKAIQELANKIQWRQKFSAIASLTKTETSSDTILNWLSTYVPFMPSLMKFLPLVFSIGSILLFVLYFINLIPGYLILLMMGLGFLISGIYSKKIAKLGSAGFKMQSTFEQYNRLIEIIEATEFESDYLNKKKQLIIKQGKKASTITKEFSRLLGNLDQNHNVFYLIFGNGFFLRGIATSYQIELWINQHGPSVKNWFEVIAFFDAYISLGTFAFNHPEYTYPKLTNESIIIKGSGVGHPLLPSDRSVLNDIHINNEQFFIITGANMAGKSTFLRTVSLQIMMANVGLPVCAKEVQYNPIKLITSMRTTDSLTDDESYFFSELKRLKFIVEEIKKDRYFIVLDEILKGTNSTDKALGSRKFVEKLVRSKSSGIIATHDLSLCEVAKDYDEVKNHYFDAEIIDNELHFDYKFKEGICQNMNASFLLKKMQIVD